MIRSLLSHAFVAPHSVGTQFLGVLLGLACLQNPAVAQPSSPELVAGSPGAKKPVALATPGRAADSDGKSYDLVVVGATPGGIACAVRAAREGLSVLLTQHDLHIGGMLTNGLFQWDALYGGQRSPLFNAYAKAIGDYYLRAYGPKSPEYDVARFSQDHYPLSVFEPSVAEREFNRLVAGEKTSRFCSGSARARWSAPARCSAA